MCILSILLKDICVFFYEFLKKKFNELCDNLKFNKWMGKNKMDEN